MFAFVFALDGVQRIVSLRGATPVVLFTRSLLPRPAQRVSRLPGFLRLVVQQQAEAVRHPRQVVEDADDVAHLQAGLVVEAEVAQGLPVLRDLLTEIASRTQVSHQRDWSTQDQNLHRHHPLLIDREHNPNRY